MGVAIGLGRLLGIAIPENFHRPELARNFLEVWSRWHITLSDWFKFYVFNPVTKELQRIADRPTMHPWLGAVVSFLPFCVIVVWHGTRPPFVRHWLSLGLTSSQGRCG